MNEFAMVEHFLAEAKNRSDANDADVDLILRLKDGKASAEDHAAFTAILDRIRSDPRPSVTLDEARANLNARAEALKKGAANLTS